MVIVVGTSHSIQATSEELKPFLKSLCRKYKVRAMAEEMSAEALAERKCPASIPMQVADSLRVAHQFCDPTRSERVKLGIQQENDIRAQAFLSGEPEADIAKRLVESHAKRERYWLEQLRGLNLWPVLFVCGADHVASFCQLLRQEGISAHVAANDWASKNTVVRDAPQAVRP